MNNKTRNIISLILNLLMIVLVVYAVGYFFTEEGLKEGVGNMQSGGTNCFKFFTIDSNILSAITSLILVPFNIKSLINNKNELPSWALILKYIGTVAVTVTFMVVLLFLGPVQGFETMFAGNCFELHLTCPLISIISFCFFEKGITINKYKALLGVIPVIIYGFVYLFNVIVFKNWIDFYTFNIGGYWYISFIVILLANYLFAYIISKIHNKFE